MKLLVLKPVSVNYSNPKRTYWRKIVKYEGGELLNVSNVVTGLSTEAFSFRLIRTPRTYWYTCMNDAACFEVLEGDREIDAVASGLKQTFIPPLEKIDF